MTDIAYEFPDKARVLGMDCSHWAGGVIDFAKAKSNGIEFVFIKAKDGLVTVDWFRENWKAAAEAGIPRGAYLWLYPSSIASTNRQADELYKLLSETGFGELPVVVDFENIPSVLSASDLYGFVVTYEQLSGQKPIIYTGPSYWEEHGSADDYWKQYKLWIANYGVQSPAVPAPWDNWTFWQFTEKGFGEDYGLDKYKQRAVDLNYFVGTRDQLLAMLEFNDDTPTNDGNGENQMGHRYSISSTYDMSLRGDHTTYAVRQSVMPQGSAAEGDELWVAPTDGDRVKAGDTWLHVLSIDGAPVDGWMAITHLGVEYCSLIDSGVPTPDPTTPPSDDERYVIYDIQILSDFTMIVNGQQVEMPVNGR